MNFFIIRHKATGKLMPPKRGTWWEPSTEKTKIPRLFFRLVDAKNAKRFWEDGCLTYDFSGSDFDDDGNLRLSIHYGTDRKVDDLEILPVTLTIEGTP